MLYLFMMQISLGAQTSMYVKIPSRTCYSVYSWAFLTEILIHFGWGGPRNMHLNSPSGYSECKWSTGHTLINTELYLNFLHIFHPYLFHLSLLTQFSSLQSLSHVWLFATPWTAARQASLSITNSWSLPKPMSIESVMPSNHLILCRPLLLLPSIFPSIRVFSNESVIRIRWPKYWSFSFNISQCLVYGMYYVFIVQLLNCICLFVTPWTDYSTPGFPDLHCLLEFAQIHLPWVDDAI